MATFEQASEFLEAFLRYFGMTLYSGTLEIPPTGERLFVARQLFSEISNVVEAAEPAILKKLGDRRESFTTDRDPPKVMLPGYRYFQDIRRIECSGRTSHGCGVVVMLNLLNDVETDLPAVDFSGEWLRLPKRQQQKFALCERSFATWGGASMLADGVQFERVAISAKSQPKASAKPTIGQQRLEFYQSLKKRVLLTTYRSAADAWNKAHNDQCDEDTFRVSCNRARQARRNKS